MGSTSQGVVSSKSPNISDRSWTTARSGPDPFSAAERNDLNRSSSRINCGAANPETLNRGRSLAYDRPFSISNLLSRHYFENFFGVHEARKLLDRAGMIGTNGTVPEFITNIDLWKLCLDNLSLTDDEGHGCLQRPLPVSTWGMVFSAVNQMDTVRSGLKRFAELAPLIPAGVNIRIGHAQDRVTINYAMQEQTSERRERYLEMLALVFHCVLRCITAKPIAAKLVRLSSLLDDRDGSLLSGISHDYARYDTGVTVAYDLEALDLPLGISKYRFTPCMETAIFFELAGQATVARERKEAKVLQDLKALLLRNPLSQQQAAHRLAMSVPTLQRQLARAGTSFRRISQEMREEKMKSLLRTRTNLDDVAFDLGFSDRRSLSRACQQWLGMSPTEYRNLFI